MTDRIRILIADDHPIVRKGVRQSIEEDPNFHVIAEAGDGEAALAFILELKPDVAILDIEMPKPDGLAIARRIRDLEIETRIIFLTLHKDEDLFRAAMDVGGKGYLLKDSAVQEILEGLRAVCSGRLYISSAVATTLLGHRQAPREPSVDPLMDQLTPTERLVLSLIVEGKSSKEIGTDLSIHYRTVENHRTNICRKFQVEGANALLRFVLQRKGSL